MTTVPNFKIRSAGIISKAFLNRGIFTFDKAASFVQQLPYRRNKNKDDLLTLFTDHCGTCSTKHALIKLLADENGFSLLRLMLGIFRMNEVNSPKISATLQKHRLEFIPEAHNYLKLDDQIFDFTKRGSSPADFENGLLEEIEISPAQITDFKVAYHKNYLSRWLASNPHIHFTLDELWEIREQCIHDLSGS